MNTSDSPIAQQKSMIQCTLGNIITNECFLLFFKSTFSFCCSLDSSVHIYISQTFRYILIVVHCFLRPVNLSPLSKSVLSMHTQPSCPSLLAEPGSHLCNVTFYLFLSCFCFLLAGKTLLCSRVNVFKFIMQ